MIAAVAAKVAWFGGAPKRVSAYAMAFIGTADAGQFRVIPIRSDAERHAGT